MKLYDALARTLADAGVGRIFGLMGDANMRYIASWIEHGEHYVAAAHEGAAVCMADGYSRVTGQVGVATTTHGPAVTNALTALGEAARARSCVVLMTSETMPRREHNQWVDLRAAARLTGAAYRRVHTAATAVDDVRLALRHSLSVRRPVLLDVPAALMSADVDYEAAQFGPSLPLPQAVAPSPDVLDSALGVIASADRPLILAGRGAVLAGAREQILALARELDAPVATSVVAMDYCAGYDLDLGIFGSESHSLAVKYISQADCIVALGAGLNHHQTSNGDLLRGKAVVHCDSDLFMLNSRYPATVAVQADARVFVEQVLESLRGIGTRPRSAWAGRLRAELRQFDPAQEYVDASGTDTVDIRTAMRALDRILPAERMVVTDIGRFKTAPWRYLRCSPGEFAQTGAFGSIGLALATAIGASFARPDRLTVVPVGDGGLMQGMLELTTAVEHRLPLLVVVLNDRSYGAEYQILADHGHDPRYSLRPWPSFADVATALGARGVVVTNVEHLDGLAADLRDLRTPMLLDVRADPAVDSRKYK